MRQWVIMGILSFLLGNSRTNAQGARFVTKAAFQSNHTRQTAMAPETVAQLRKHGVTSESELKLEYFFHTNSQAKAQALAVKLEAKGYDVEFGPSASDKTLLVITGWTTPVAMDTENVVSWAGEMARLGYEHDCEFEGWSTNPNQSAHGSV